MNIYVDFDDVLCETARSLSNLANEMFQRKVPYEEIRGFDLQVAFSLPDQLFSRFMDRAHEEEYLASMPMTPGVADSIHALCAAGHQVSIFTGRPAFSYRGSLAWLKRYGLEKIPLFHVDKYQRPSNRFTPGQPPTLRPSDLDAMALNVLIDDSPIALDFFRHRVGSDIFVFDRPWNQDYPLTGQMRRVKGWQEIVSILL